MRNVSIIGTGMIPVGEHWASSLRSLATDALRLAMNDAGIQRADALFVGNAFGASMSSQSHLGCLIADHTGLQGIEAYTIEAADASGGAALRAAFLAVASGAIETALVVGVEKCSDAIGDSRYEGRSIALDADYEAIQGATLPALTAMLMRRYLHEYDLDTAVFEGFSINAHSNGSRNPNAMFRNRLKPGVFSNAPMIADPVGLFDAAPDADGAAAVVLASSERAADLVSKPVRILASAAATDTLMIQDRVDPLYLSAVGLSTNKALQQANITIQECDFFELHDAFTILTALSLEAVGLAEKGEGWKWAANSGQDIALSGKLPISTFGGLKSRGNPAGATGVYQAVEAATQLRGEAGDNQVRSARIGLIQNLGGVGSTAVTHILSIETESL